MNQNVGPTEIKVTDCSPASRRRERLLESAIAAFAEKGFHGTTTRDIASAAGMSPAALYVHHRSKEELLYLIAKDGHENVLSLIHDAVTADTPAEALRQAVRDFAIYHAREHASARIINYELAALDPQHLAEISKIRRQIEDEISQLVARGADSGDFDARDPRITGAAILSLGIDLARWYCDSPHWTAEEIADQYVEIALRIVGGQRIG